MINLSSTVRLASGYTMPRLGFGVYQSIDAKASVLEALKAGYRLFEHRSLITYLVSHLYTDMSTLLSTIKMKQKWQRPLGFQEYLEKIFLSVSVEITSSYYPVFVLISCSLTASKCMSSTHGYESTLRGVNKSLKRMKFGL